MSLNRHTVDGHSCMWDNWYGRFNFWTPEKGNQKCPHPHDTLTDKVELILRSTVYAGSAGPVGGIGQAVERIVALMSDE